MQKVKIIFYLMEFPHKKQKLLHYILCSLYQINNKCMLLKKGTFLLIHSFFVQQTEQNKWVLP